MNIINTASSNKPKKTAFSGIQPTGMPMLGNYIGAMKNMKAFQDDYDCIYCVVDMHSITVRHDPEVLRANIRRLFALYIAAGLDPEKSVIFVQSHVMEHAQLAWILNCYTYMGELSRMTQFKDKSKKHAENINAGLYDYPVLMASDILLYQAGIVPVGEDQKQHVELARDIAIRFNNIHAETFTVPEVYISKGGARIMSLQEPTRKMDKSETENLNNVIFMLDEPKTIITKIKKAVTDSEALVRYSEDKPGVSNLLSIYSSLAGKTISDSEKDFEGKNYGYFKNAVAETVVSALEPIQKRYYELAADESYITGLMRPNAEKASQIAQNTLIDVQKKIGFVI